MSVLCRLPSEVLAGITDHLEWDLVCRLYECGSGALNTLLLGGGVRRVRVEGGCGKYPLLWPLRISGLHNLLHFTMIEDSACGICYDMDIPSLPQSLKSLKLSFHNAFDAFTTASTEDLHPRILLDISSHFPRLESLHLWSSKGLCNEFFPTLPRTLTSLSLSASTEQEFDSSFLNILPPQLVSLCIGFHYDESNTETKFPPDLTELAFSATVRVDIHDKLPQGLTMLNARTSPPYPKIAEEMTWDWKRLPRNLRRLALTGGIVSSPACRVADLPRGLTELELNHEFSTQGSTKDLPTGLLRGKLLKIPSEEYPLLPASIQDLSIAAMVKDQQEVNQIPHSLTTLNLYLERMVEGPLSFVVFQQLQTLHFTALVSHPQLLLPTSLTEVNLYSTVFKAKEQLLSQLTQNCPNLLHLAIPLEALPTASSIAAMPASVTHLSIMCNDKSRSEVPYAARFGELLPMKANLRSLFISAWIFDATPGSAESFFQSIAQLTSLKNFQCSRGLKDGINESCLAHLPSSLRHIDFGFRIDSLSSAGLKALPPKLTTLFLQGTTNLKPSDLQFLPRSLNLLSLPRIEKTEEDLYQYLPPNLEKFYSYPGWEEKSLRYQKQFQANIALTAANSSKIE